MKVEVVERQIDVVAVGTVEVSEVVVTRTVEVAAGHVEAHESADDPHPVYETATEAQAKVDTHEIADDPHGDRLHADAFQYGSLCSFNQPAPLTGSAGAGGDNSALLAQVYAWRGATVAQFVWFAIGNPGGRTYEVGIYDDAGTLLWKTGGTWPTGNSNMVEAVSPVLTLDRGRTYWVALATESSTDSFSFIGHNFGLGLWGLDGRSLARRVTGLVGSTLPATVDLASTFDMQRGPYVRLTE